MLAVITVDTEQDIVDPSDHFTSLREAVATTNDLEGIDTITFDFGHDDPVAIRLEHNELELTDAVTIAGPGRESLTIDAQHESRIFNITATEGDFVIEGLTLTGGRGIGSDDPFVGGAIRSDTAALLTLRNGAITNSEVAKYDGGSAIAAAGDVAIEYSIISGNIGAIWWGSVHAHGHVTVSSSAITENSSGGIRADGDVTIRSSTISRNGDEVPANGGALWPGIVESGGDVTVSSSVISENSISGIRASGNVAVNSSTISGNHGGIEIGFGTRFAGGIIARGDVAVTFSTVSGNTVGGIIAGGNATIQLSTISGNTGRGVRASGNATIESSTISGNTQGGISVSGNATIESSTIVGNSFYAGVRFFSDLILKNSIVAANQGGDLEPARQDPAVWTVTHSLVGHKSGTPLVESLPGRPDSSGNIIGGPIGGAIDPRLGPLSDNGGPTLSHALLPDSPAVNMGDPLAGTSAGSIPRYIARGEIRPLLAATYPLEKLVEAQQAFIDKKHTGNIVVTLD